MAKLTDIERLHYYEGEYLGAADLEAEQEYHRDMRRRHSVGQHTWGIVAGLELAQVPNGGPNGEVDVYLMPGMAIDGFGREIVALNRVQITQEPFAPYFDPNAGAAPRPMYLWVAYDQSLIRASQDACRNGNNASAFARVQESYRVAVTSDPSSPPNDPLVVDGVAMSPSAAPSGPPAPGQVILPPDSSVPFQEFDADDSALSWYVPIGRVLWDPHKELFLPLPDSSAAQGRRYTGAVAAEIFAPGGTLDVVDRFAPSPLPSIPTDPFHAGVNVDIAGSLHIQRALQVEGTSNLVTKSLLGARIAPNEKTLSPLTIAADGVDGNLIQFRSNATTETWRITENPGGANPGINFAEISNGNPVDGRLFIQSTLTGSAPSLRNIGVGTLTPRNPLSIRGQGASEELLAFEDSSGATRWHINYNPDGKSASVRGLNFGETGIQDYRLFLQAGGNVGVGTAAPQQNLSVGAGLNIDQANANSGTIGPGPGLTFGSHSGEGIASARSGGASKNQAGLDFYTAFAPRLSITQGGNVGIGTNTPESQLHLTGGQWDLNATEGDFKIGNPAMRLKMGVALGGAGAGDARIYAHGGTSRMMLGLGDALTIFNQRIGINTINPSVALEVAGDVHITGKLKVDGAKSGYVADRFVYPAGLTLQRGDVVVLSPNPKVNIGAAGRIPLFEVMLTDQAQDTRVCGVVDEPELPPSEVSDLGLTGADARAGLMVTLGAYAYCKVDATKLEVKPGDLLATSDAKGYASPVPPGGAKAGSIIGKALGALPKRKKGLIAILVTHQ